MILVSLVLYRNVQKKNSGNLLIRSSLARRMTLRSLMASEKLSVLFFGVVFLGNRQQGKESKLKQSVLAGLSDLLICRFCTMRENSL